MEKLPLVNTNIVVQQGPFQSGVLHNVQRARRAI
jgi:hypothetical protein